MKGLDDAAFDRAVHGRTWPVCRHKGTQVPTTPGRRLWAKSSLGAGSSFGNPQARRRAVEKPVRFCYESGCSAVAREARPRRTRPGRTRRPGPLRPPPPRRARARPRRSTSSITASASPCSASASACRGRLGLGLCRGDRVELLLRRQLAALGVDRDAQRGGRVAEELDRDLVAADPLDRLGQVELAPVDPHLLRLPDALGDVGRGDRAEERAGLAGRGVEADLRGLRASARSPAPARSSAPRGARASPRACAARRPWRAWPPPRACAAAGSCARSPARRRPPRRGGRPSRRPV